MAWIGRGGGTVEVLLDSRGSLAKVDVLQLLQWYRAGTNCKYIYDKHSHLHRVASLRLATTLPEVCP